ncbi:MAG TPA: triose-phosphate isomerase [Blastocatellia bacterium]|nr:triose-phosphate isomerase [Blastocatellia bacterium]HMV86058.1 triose-phosphate isomerase [Blastocatellia bacterium]HMX28163.1 triose-phosphate isomerase [Blastocatellia bacterium]HMY75818.1 triose-phosphate isomerase [Blastocatellia bacterium]HNG31997.1 triose-phosphate isomerase [Blastocatellia bacterium]
MRKPIIAGNWKMFKLIGEAVATATALKPLVANANHCEVIVAPPFTALKSVADRLEGSNIKVAAQNISAELKHGAHTGEICGDMLKDAGCRHTIIGHSERRSMYGDTDAVVNRKLRAAFQFGLTPIVCIGETLEERDAGDAEKVVATQLKDSLAELTASEVIRIVLAYEPVWAIGTGRTATPTQAQQMHAFIRQWISQTFDTNAANDLRILYGGSVKPENISELMRETDIDGALVGGASLEAESFSRIVNYDR